MGNVLNSSEPGNAGFIVPPNPNMALQNRTFLIKDRPYTLIERLGGGAFGSVWSATTRSGRPAAVKTIDISGRTSSQFDPMSLIESFDKEIKMAYKMRQETRHVVTIYGFDFDMRSGLALMAMELGGDTLAARVEKLHYVKHAQRKHADRGVVVHRGSDYISAAERKNIWVQLVNIVLTLHRHHVIHRDLKPDNLVFFGPIMKIVDLGIAQKEVLGYNANRESIGTPFYSAPECFVQGSLISSEADIWSAGAILYFMTYGQPPMKGSSRPPRTAHRTSSPYVDNILHGCLRSAPQQRGTHPWLASHPYTVNPSAL